MTKTVLIGLGNLLMTDEGIGVRILQELVRTKRVPDSVEALDLGPGGLQVLHAFEGKERAILVDCAFMDLEPGTLRKFSPEDVQSVKVRARQSLHEGDLFETLELAKGLGKCPAQVVLFAIQPSVVELGDSLSELLAEKLASYVVAVAEELRRA
jgi:hydrogenase maturation protease